MNIVLFVTVLVAGFGLLFNEEAQDKAVLLTLILMFLPFAILIFGGNI